MYVAIGCFTLFKGVVVKKIKSLFFLIKMKYRYIHITCVVNCIHIKLQTQCSKQKRIFTLNYPLPPPPPPGPLAMERVQRTGSATP